MQTFILEPINGRKSFGNKAKVIIEDETAKLLSYDTIVAEINLKTNEYKDYGFFSKTTSSHINAFKNFYGI
jgi:hypothetical protein